MMLPIYHMASMARCGETVTLRNLSFHPRIKVVAQVDAMDSKENMQLFDFLKGWTNTEIPLDNEYLQSINPSVDDIILVKQGIWEHRASFNGFVLVRNPVSVYASLLEYDKNGGHKSWLNNMLTAVFTDNNQNKERMLRWMQDIDKNLIPYMENIDDISLFCAFYNRRMMPLINLGLKVIHYERLVTDPACYFKIILKEMHLPFDYSVLHAHKNYSAGTIGHGKSDLSISINTDSLDNYRSIGHRTFDRICALTYPTWSKFGYVMDWDHICINWD